MPASIKIAKPEEETIQQMEHWLIENIGPGSHRTIKNGFMGMDDWFSYDENNLDDGEDYEYDDDLDEDNYQEFLIFTFRREEDATMFALKWTTQTV